MQPNLIYSYLCIINNKPMRRIYLIAFLIITSLCSYAQDTIHFTNTHYVIGGLDTTPNHSFSIVDTMYNFGPNVIQGPITFNVKINGVLADTSHFNSANTLSSGDSLMPFTSKRLTFTVNNDTAPPFVAGANLIIIWPVYHVNGSPGYVGVNDSIIVNADYFPLGLTDAPLAKIFIYQLPGQLAIHLGDAENQVKQVRIYNIIGQSVYTDSPEHSERINTSGWISGVYLCEVTTYSGEKRTLKFKLE